MNIIVAGGGKVGTALVRQLTTEGHDMTLIDMNGAVLSAVSEQFDTITIRGNCASMETLLDAGIQQADLLIAATNADEVNLLCCTTAHGLKKDLHTIARIRNPEYTQQIYKMRDIFGLSMTVNPEKQAATEIERLLKYPGFLRRDTFANGRTEIVELRIDRQSKLRDVCLNDLQGIIKCKVLVCAVLRDGTAMVPNSGTFVLKEGDRLFVTALSDNLATLLKNLGIIARRVRRVMLCGGGRISYYLAQELEKSGIHVTLIEQNHARCEALAEDLPDSTIVCGDCTNQNLLEGEGLSDCDAVVTLTGVDELNMIVSLYAGSRNVPQVITKLGHGETRTILHTLPLGSIISPKELCSNIIVRYVRAMQNQTGAAVSVHAIADGQAEAMEFLVDSTTKNCGIPLKDIKLKPNVLLVSIAHGAGTEIPNGNSVFHEGDSVVVVTNGRGLLGQLNDIFA